VDLGSGPITFVAGDDVIYNGTVWQRSPSGVTVTSVAGKTGDVVLDKNDVGLGNVDNTSDLDKPISTAVQNALDLKLDASEISNYYTKTQMQTSGQAQMHWDNITNVPGGLGVQTLSEGPNYGNLGISSGNTINLRSLGNKGGIGEDLNSLLTSSGFVSYTNSTGSTGFPTVAGTGVLKNRNGADNSQGAFTIWKNNVNDGKLMFNVGTTGTSWKGWETFASEEHVAANYVTLGTAQTI